ncbi:hypothetical protein MIND_00314200 [Mycena indigotica]|uniref:C3H1-type domain-containing protein n=1 Tax=Mycena indigotica TaxID=2126181 RepID=A0A8H6W888_9AGAR|nr:uncharacterized protein MIND_00314200 [Mycena indigotica]KAF7309434.1 hypothetical protein MIND_00314200 [Mycena indigotica]
MERLSAQTAAQNHSLHPIERCLENLKDEVTHLVANEKAYSDMVEKLQTELSAFKRAYADVDTELKAAKAALDNAETLNAQLQKDEAARITNDQGSRVVMLIDGDGAIFSTQLISQGQKGGHTAAQRLSDGTMQALTKCYGARAYQLWVYVFFNRQGLLNAFRRSGHVAVNGKLEDFIVGFNQATERFIMVDVGSTKEAADAKLKVYLEDEIRLSQTFKVIFGGCHDNGYIANLQSQITAGYKEKLMLLKGYNEMASGIAMFQLPTLTIDGLFLTKKLAEDVPSVTKAPLGGNVGLGPAMSSQLPSPPVITRQLDPKLAMSKQNPPPCTLYYLKNSCLNSHCPHAHDYILTPAQLNDFANGAKRAPCPFLNKVGKECHFGQDCCYGHMCTKHPKCPFHKQGNCKFKHPWSASQEKGISRDYPLETKNEACDDYLARTYFQFLWLPESIMPLKLLVPSLQRANSQSDASIVHPLHSKLERLLLTTRTVNSKYHVELAHILANGGGEGEEEESMMWYAVTHEKSENDLEEPWLDDTWRTKWLDRMERREVQIQILLHLFKLSLSGPSPPPDMSQSPRKKRRKIGEREPPPLSLEDRLEAFMDKLSMWQLMGTLDTGLRQRHDTQDRDWMQTFCVEVVEPRFGTILANQISLLREKVFPHSPFSDTDDADEWDAPGPKPPTAQLQRTKTTANTSRSRTNSTVATLDPKASVSDRARSRSLSVTLAEEEQRERQRVEADDGRRRVLKREVSMKRSFTPTLSVRDTAEAAKRAEEKRKEVEGQQKKRAEEAAKERERIQGVTLVEATPVKPRAPKIGL